MNNMMIAQKMVKMHPIIMEEFHRIDVRFVEGLDLSLVQFKSFMVIATEKKCNLGDISGALSITPGWASETVEKLVKKELISRVPSSDDRRQVILSLTLKGEEFLQSFQKWSKDYFMRLLEILDDPNLKVKLLHGVETLFDVAMVLREKRLSKKLSS